MEKAIESFTKYQRDAEERFQKWEEERWRKETELGEKHRREDREHEMRLFQMLGQMMKPREGYSTASFTPPPYGFDYEY